MELDKLPRNKQILEKYRKAKEKRQLKDHLWNELDQFDRGEQWRHAGSIPPWIAQPVTNFVHMVKTIKRAAFAIENNSGKLRSLIPEDKQQVEKLQKVMKYEWEQTNSRKMVRDVIETGKLLGTGIAHVYYDEDFIGGKEGHRYEGKVNVRQIDPGIFYPDPTAHRLEDCQFVHLVERKPISWLKKHPKFGAKFEEVAPKLANEDIGEIYNRDDTKSSKEGIIDFHSHFEKVANGNGGYTYKVTYLAGDKVLHTVEELKPACYPFAIYYDFPQRQDFWGKSTCEVILDNQKLLNKVESIIAMIGTLLQNPQAIVSRSSGLNPRIVKQYSTAPGHVFVAQGDPSKAIIWKQPPQIPQALFNLEETAKESIREITGVTQTYMGQNVGSLQTSSGVDQLMQRATMRDRDQMFDLEMFIKDLSLLELKFIVEKYNTKRYARVLGVDGLNDEYIEYTGTDFKELLYDFIIDVSAEAPVTRQRMMEEAEKLLTIQGQYQFDPPIMTPDEFMSMSNFANKEHIQRRMQFDKEHGLMEFIQQLAQMRDQALQGGVPPEEVEEMTMSMIQQYQHARTNGTGSAADNSGQMQNRQGQLGV